MNELLLLLEIAVFFTGVLLVKKFFGLPGLYAWIAVSACLAQIQTIKSVDILGIGTTMGNVTFASIFLCTDIIRECYGKEEAKKGTQFILLGSFVFIVFALITVAYRPSSFDIGHVHLREILVISLRLTTVSVLSLFVASRCNVWLYSKVYNLTRGKHLWLRNNISTIICNTLENILFTFFAWVGIFTWQEMLSCVIGASILEIIIAVCDTPFVYWARKEK